MDGTTVGAGYQVLSSKVATLGCEDFTTASRGWCRAFHLAWHMQGRRTLNDFAKSEKEAILFSESLTLRRSAGGSESKSRSSSLDVDSLMTAHWTCLMYQTIALFGAPMKASKWFLQGGCWCWGQ